MSYMASSVVFAGALPDRNPFRSVPRTGIRCSKTCSLPHLQTRTLLPGPLFRADIRTRFPMADLPATGAHI